MATITKKSGKEARLRVGSTPYGNLTAFTFSMKCASTGAVIDTEADQSTSTAAGTVIRLGIIPAGFRLVDYVAAVSTAFTATMTFKAGFEYVDGVDVTGSAAQDDDYFASGVSNAAAVTRKTATTKAVTIPKDAYFIVTTAVAANVAAAEAEFTVFAVADGPN